MEDTPTATSNIMGVVTMGLDIATKYGYLDKNEVQWVYTYQKLGDDEGWFAWVTRPGQKEFCIGRITEKEILEKLTNNPPPLDQDDLIDLELWIDHGGLELYSPKKDKEI